MNDRDVWLGIDLGTQSVRALAVTADGRVAARGSHRLESSRDGDRHEQDPQAWWDAAAAACRDTLEDLVPERVRGVAVDGTSGTVLLLDSSGRPASPALMYDDARAGDAARRANEAGEEVWSSLGYRIRATWGLPKLLWLLEQRGDPADEVRLAHQPDLVTRRLVGRDAPTDWSHALKSGYDLLHDRWPPEVLARLGISEEVLPEVVAPGSQLGEVQAEAARETGIPTGTPVMAGMTDSCAAQLAAGALTEGSWNFVLGTTLALKGVSRELIRDPNGVLYCHRAPGGSWLPGGASSSGAGILAREFADRDLGGLTAAAVEHEDTEVLAYPLASRGERFPFHADDAEGFVLGRPAGDAERMAALLEGLALTQRLCLDYAELLGAPTGGELGLTGGAARNRHLCQLSADALERPVRLPESAESAFGMAMLAASAGGSLNETARAMVRVREVVEPRPERFERCRERYLRLVGELDDRGWLDESLASHAGARAAG